MSRFPTRQALCVTNNIHDSILNSMHPFICAVNVSNTKLIKSSQVDYVLKRCTLHFLIDWKWILLSVLLVLSAKIIGSEWRHGYHHVEASRFRRPIREEFTKVRHHAVTITKINAPFVYVQLPDKCLRRKARCCYRTISLGAVYYLILPGNRHAWVLIVS